MTLFSSSRAPLCCLLLALPALALGCSAEESTSTRGFASRYWDCCKHHCAWSENAPAGAALTCDASNQVMSTESSNACDAGGNGYTCWNMAPWAVSESLAYGYAAVPAKLGGGCGLCYQLNFTGVGHHDAADPGSVSLAGKSMIVQVSNIGYDVGAGQFDLLIPGGGVGQFNACSAQWGVTDAELGARYGGLLTSCDNDPACLRTRCESLFNDKPELLSGCLFHADWMAGADNPEFDFAEVPCPPELMQVSGMLR